MRTTVTLDDDVAAAVEDLRRRDGAGVSEVVNRLVRMGLAAPRPRATYQHESYPMGFRIDIDNIADVLESLDEA